VLAYCTLHAVAATPLDPEVAQRLQALLVDRVAPLLLRCLQVWEDGAQRLLSCADALLWLAGWALAPAARPGHATGRAGCCRRAAPQACTGACQRGGVPWWLLIPSQEQVGELQELCADRPARRRPAADPRRHRLPVQRTGGTDDELEAHVRARAREGARTLHALRVHQPAVDLAAHPGDGAHSSRAVPCMLEQRQVPLSRPPACAAPLAAAAHARSVGVLFWLAVRVKCDERISVCV